MKSGWLACLAAVLVVPCFLGCNGPGADTAKVQGKVTVAGQPMAGVAVNFAPESGRPASGITDSSGNFTLATFSKGDGAIPGKHKVSFSYSNVQLGPDGKPPAGGPDNTVPTGSGGGMPKPPMMPGTPFNSKYTSGSTSGIEVEVTKGKTNEFTWDLEK
jgi:hypothetical protein